MNKYRIILAVAIVLSFCVPARADSPFHWPVSYSVECVQTGKGDPITNRYAVDGLKARNEVKFPGGGRSITIFRGDKGRVISIEATGAHYESPMQDDFTVGHPFSTDGVWEKTGTDEFAGVRAVKYKVTSNPATPSSYFLVWLTEDGKTPLKMTNAAGTLTRTFSAYSAGPQNPALFEP